MYQEWRGGTLSRMLEYSARNWPDNVAVRDDQGATTYAELAENVQRTKQGLLAAGIRPGDHVAHFMSVGTSWIELFFAVTAIGARLVPLNLTWVDDEIVRGLDMTDARHLVTGITHRGESLLDRIAPVLVELEKADKSNSALPKLEQVILTEPVAGQKRWPDLVSLSASATTAQDVSPPKPDDIALLLLTSGSTSFPKPAMLTHEAILAGVASYADGLEAGARDVFLHCTPNYHVGGINTMGLTLMRGATLRLMDWFVPEEAMRIIDREKVSLFWGFDTHYLEMRRHPNYGKYDLSSVTRTMSGSNPATFDKIHEMGFGHIGGLYGSTEYMGSQAFFPYRDRFDVERMKYSNGRATSGEIRIIDPDTGKAVGPGDMGEICARGPCLFKGYYKMPDETAECFDEDGFFHSGDYGFMDGAGYLYYRGRYKEMVKTGGENVATLEVEMFLRTEIAGAQRVLVCGTPHSKWGEAVTALIELAPGYELTEKDVREACKGKIAGYKIPKRVFFVPKESWEISPTGKLNVKAAKSLALALLSDADDSGAA